LEPYLSSKNDRESDLALRFLAAIGTRESEQRLAKFAQAHPSPGRRRMALLWLSQAHWDIALPVLKEARDHDPDAGVRKQAAEILAAHEVSH
jgi:hypothetical protein